MNMETISWDTAIFVSYYNNLPILLPNRRVVLLETLRYCYLNKHKNTENESVYIQSQQESAVRYVKCLFCT